MLYGFTLCLPKFQDFLWLTHTYFIAFFSCTVYN